MVRGGDVRVILIGDHGVGKTSLVNWLQNDEEEMETPKPTVAAEYMKIEFHGAKGVQNIILWDTAGQERFKSLGKIYYHGSQAGIFVYDVKSPASLSGLEGWISEFRENADESAMVFIVANKADLVDVDSADFDEGREWAEMNGWRFFKTSAKTGLNVKQMFGAIFEDVLRNSSGNFDVLEEQDRKCAWRCC